MSKAEIGCCGAYCKTCKVFVSGVCKGCKLGYDTGERDIAKAKCAMKVCCIAKGFDCCADCAEFETCLTLAAFYGHDGYKYKKYREAAAFIRTHGYEAFLRQADGWSGVYGKME